jgi:hypothetical protein
VPPSAGEKMSTGPAGSSTTVWSMVSMVSMVSVVTPVSVWPMVMMIPRKREKVRFVCAMPPRSGGGIAPYLRAAFSPLQVLKVE